ncbi:MAG: DMT family transporter [Clostridia bacterium]|nr:DMT family transporter [Clostridia bacterium]
MYMALALVILGGCCMAFQSPTNAELSKHVGNFPASAVSFSVGTIVLAIATSIFGTGDVTQAVNAQPWQLLGGLYGATIVVVITYAAPVLGIALTLTFSMLGQLIFGTVIDTFGLLGMPVAPVGPFRVAGCLAVAAGIFCVYAGKKTKKNPGEKSDSSGKQPPKDKSGKSNKNKDKSEESQNADGGKTALLALLSFVAGAAAAVQAPTNNSLALLTGKIEASLISFAGGMLILVIISFIKGHGHIIEYRKKGIRPWMLTGGLYGATFVFISVIAIPKLGAALIVAATMLGQLAAGILVDCTGIMRAAKVKMNAARYTGVVLIAIGVIFVAYSKL